MCPRDPDTTIRNGSLRTSAGGRKSIFADYVFDSDEDVSTEEDEDEGAGRGKDRKGMREERGAEEDG